MTTHRTSRHSRSRSNEPPRTTAADLTAWFVEALPDDWFTEPPTVRHDTDEILVTGDLGQPGAGLSDDQQVAAFREATREQRMTIADQAQAQFRRRVSWGVGCGDTEVRFTTVKAPAMTRLRIDERLVLDTLIDAGVARSRSDALSWCVRLVGEHEHDWISELRDAVDHVRAARESGPGGGDQDGDQEEK